MPLVTGVLDGSNHVDAKYQRLHNELAAEKAKISELCVKLSEKEVEKMTISVECDRL